jgi:hypothetical protein
MSQVMKCKNTSNWECDQCNKTIKGMYIAINQRESFYEMENKIARHKYL